jgi:hypothetical protein
MESQEPRYISRVAVYQEPCPVCGTILELIEDKPVLCHSRNTNITLKDSNKEVK